MSKTKSRLKIVGATFTVIFTLASVFTGTWAWFASNASVTATGMQVMVSTGGGPAIKETRLIKFNYGSMTFGNETMPDYINPENGHVQGYTYDSTIQNGTFGYYDEEDEWITTDGMNPYDPIEKGIKGSGFDLSSLNCNAIYAVTFYAPTDDFLLQISSIKKNVNTPDASKREIALSPCVDFDVYFLEDLTTSESTYVNDKNYAVGEIIIFNNHYYKCKATGNTGIDPSDESGSTYWEQISDYSSSYGYAVNDLAIEGNKVYKCKTSIGKAFSNTDWKAINEYSTDPETTYHSGDFVLCDEMIYRCTNNVNGSATTPDSDSTNWNSLAYSGTSTYKANDFVVYGVDNTLYKCNTAIDEAEAEFDSAKWDEVGTYSSSSTYSKGEFVYESSNLYQCVDGNKEYFTASHWDAHTTYSGTSTYEEGDVVLNDGCFYKCKVDISSPEAEFNKAHWQAIIYDDCYYPSYKELENNTLNDEEIYYRISYLSSKSEHKNFYSQNDPDDPINLLDSESYFVAQSNNEFTVYINVNYAPEQLNEYYSKITSMDIVYKALYDFVFNFEFVEAPAQQGGGE